MEEDNEILDWGNEDDESHETLRKPPFNNAQQDPGELDPEDSISLGDEDEETSTPQTTLLTASDSPLAGEPVHQKVSTPRKSSFSEDSPRRKQQSRELPSPQRSQPNPGRLTHALPPKPVTTKVPPYLPPSHPSIVEATSMTTRAGGRESKKGNGVSSATSIPITVDELPHNWECREARSGGGRYYYNTETHICTWEKPVSSIPPASTESRSRRRRSPSTGLRRRRSPDSNPPEPQTTPSSRNSAHVPPNHEVDDGTRNAVFGPIELSYDDRHYRPSGEHAAVEIPATERHSELVNGRVSSQSRYDRMPPASPPPSRRRARSSSPRASYLHEKEKEYQPSRANSHSTRGQNAYTNDPQRDLETLQLDPGYAEPRWVRSPPPPDFHSSHRDSSRRHGRRHNDDESMIDEHPDSRNRPSLRRRESSHEPNRNRDLPPRPSEFREDANQNPAAPRRGSTPPPHARDRDQYYEPIIRDYRDHLEEDSRSIAPSSSRRDKSLRHDHPAPSVIGPPVNLIPLGPKVNRPRDIDLIPSSNFTHPTHRVNEREYDRNRREHQILERDGLPRRPVEYPPPANQVPEQSKGHYDREPSRPHSSAFDRSSQDVMGQQSSHRKRLPLLPQTMSFLTSSNARDATDSENGRSQTSSTLAPAPPRLPGDKYGEMRDRDRDRGRQEASGMKEERMDRYSRQPRSRSRGRPAEYMRAPSQPSSGTNNIPIGIRKSSMPPAIPFNPDARPPPSTLIDPAKARELLPPGKESYERPADLGIADMPQVKTANDAPISNTPHTSQRSENSEQQPALPPIPAKPRQRKSRFDKPAPQPAPQPEPRKEPSPVSDKGSALVSQSDASDMRAATPPPPSRELSVQSLHDQAPPSPLPARPDSALPSSWSGQRSENRWSNNVRGNSQNPTFEQPQEYLGLPNPPTSLSHRLSDDKLHHRQHPSSGPMSVPDEGEVVELSFHNAHAALKRGGSEEGMILQSERPQMARRGASLLDRLSTGNSRSYDQQSLRDRMIPSKRDLEDLMDEGMRDGSFDGEDGNESKRARRKNGRARTRGGRRAGPA